jgi:CRP-like cAMP-binding protein
MESVYTELIDFINILSGIKLLKKDLFPIKLVTKNIKKGAIILREGDYTKKIGFVINGLFRYYYNDFTGNERTKYFVKEYDFVFSLSSFIENKKSPLNIEALKDSKIIVAKSDDLYNLIQKNITWKSVYIKILENLYIKKEKREADFLLYNAKERYINFVKEYPILNTEIKQHYIASYLGITPESLSRIKNS